MPITLAILRELSNLPSGYLAQRDALRNNVRWATCPQPTYAEIDAALSSLEEAGQIIAQHNNLVGLRYAISDKGRLALANAIE